MSKPWRCRFGFHKWYYRLNGKYVVDKTCLLCKEHQVSSSNIRSCDHRRTTSIGAILHERHSEHTLQCLDCGKVWRQNVYRHY
jgi:hypothetical protein